MGICAGEAIDGIYRGRRLEKALPLGICTGEAIGGIYKGRRLGKGVLGSGLWGYVQARLQE